MRRSSDRLRFQEQQFARLGIRFERVEAVEGSAIVEDIYADVRCAWQRPTSRGELGCFLSHRAAWRRVVDSGHSALVVEDDVLLSDNLVPVLLNLDCPDDEPVTFNIESCYARKVIDRKADSVSLPSDYRIRPTYFDCGGSAAYIVTPSAAQLYLDHSERCVGLVDAYMNLLKYVKRMQIEPALAVQMRVLQDSLDQSLAGAAHSTLGHRPVDRPADLPEYWAFCRMKLRRLSANMRKSAIRMRTLGYATKDSIPICQTIEKNLELFNQWARSTPGD